MAATVYAGNTTKPHMGGANSEVDIHLEIYHNEVDTRFQYDSIFLGLSSQRSVAGQSNTYRIDRLNTSTVKSRTSGVALDSQKVTNDKILYVVDTVVYIRNPFDWQDQWTSPDWLMEIARNNASEFAETFDEAHIIQLIKARAWTAPAHLKPAFSDGLTVNITYKAAPANQAEREANAVALKRGHLEGINQLIKRKVSLRDMVTIVDVDTYAALLEHPKLLNLEVAGGAGDGDYNGRRFVRLNGIPVIEVTEFPTTQYNNTTTKHVLQSTANDFTLTADDLKVKMITFSKSMALLTINAHSFTSKVWDDDRDFGTVLDMYQMYGVGIRRADTIVSHKLVEPV